MPGDYGEPEKQKFRFSACSSLCCNSCRLSISSSEEGGSPTSSSKHATICSLEHTMVQERLGGRIKGCTKLIMIVAMEKSSCNPREDFRESMVQMVMANQFHQPKDLRRLLNCYLSVNSEQFRHIILEVFYEVCHDLFLNCKNSYFI
ncbi:hypothetical protein NMG60_11009886 [Bertholletia excelsa]